MANYPGVYKQNIGVDEADEKLKALEDDDDEDDDDDDDVVEPQKAIEVKS